MTKIMLVEDDNNLREIYEARLAAEGYDIVAAPDGEAALAMAGRERPDLVITDVMMPKISGFEMLDILRNTDALKGVKVIMLTALGQAEDNARAGALGADRYLVKSQVTLEDIVKAAHDLLEEVTIPAGDVAAATAAAAALNGDGGDSSDSTLNTGSTDAATTDPAAATTTTDTPVFPEPSLPSDVPASVPTPAAASSDVPADATVLNDAVTTAENVQPVANVPEQDLELATSEADNAQTASQEESDIRAQIDQFVEKVDAGQPAAEPETNSLQEASGPAPQALSDASEPVTIQAINDTLAEASEDELQRDAAAPDMGQLSVHEAPAAEPAAQPDAAQQNGQSAAGASALPTQTDQPAAQPDYQASTQPAAAMPAGYPSQSFELPTVAGAAIGSETVAAPAQQPPVETAGDKVVSDAVNTMLTDAASKPPVLPPSQTASQATTLPGSQPASEPPVQSADTTPNTAPSAPAETVAVPPAPEVVEQTPPASLPEPSAPAGQPAEASKAAEQPAPVQPPSASKRVIAPISQPSNKPDINQLLAMEEAKAAAAQAAQQAGQPVQPAAPAPQQPSAPVTQPVAPATPAPTPPGTLPPVDPNAVAM